MAHHNGPSRVAAALSVGWVAAVAVAMMGCVETPARVCDPGRVESCPCVGGGRGVQMCAADGRRFLACECGTTLDGGPTPDGATTHDGGDGGTDGGAGDGGGVDAGAGPVNCAMVGTGLPAGWRRGVPARFTDVALVTIAGVRWNPFPVSGGLGRIFTANGVYLSIEFDTPSDVAAWFAAAPFKQILWERSQVDGEADVVYVGLSACPGDFRIPRVDAVAPAGDPTFAAGCRSFRRLSGAPSPQSLSNMSYEISEAPSDPTTCRLAPGRRYYLNFIRAEVTDGAIGAPDEESARAACANPELMSCGVQMRVF
jgi:hypothetical protein